MRIMGNEVTMPETPQAKFWAWIVGIGVGTLMGWLFLDGHFMRAADGATMKAEYTAQIAALSSEMSKQLSANSLQVEYSADQNAKRAIDNNLYELEQTPPNKLKPQDRALYQKLQRDRAELVDLWIRRGRPLR